MKALLVVLRGLHLGYLGCYGNGWIDTPSLDALAAEGVVFDQHISDCPEAEAARRAWRTGCDQFPPSLPELRPPHDLLQILRGRGIVSSLVLDESRPLPETLADGWEYIRRVHADTGESTALERALEDCAEALDELATHDDWLLCLDLGTLLPPWNVPEEYFEPYFTPGAGEDEDQQLDEEPLEPLPEPASGVLDAPQDETFLRLQGSYAAAVSYADAGIGLLLEALHERKIADELLILVATDHGQALGEHGFVGNIRPWLHDELVHLPLLIRLPRKAEAGRRIAALTQSVDLFSTLLDAFELPVPPNQGHSLLPLLRGETEKVRPYASSGMHIGDCEEWALRTPEWAYLLPIAGSPREPQRLPQLYVKPDDRWEVNNIIQHHLELAEHLEKTLRTFHAATEQPGPLQVPPLAATKSGEPSP